MNDYDKFIQNKSIKVDFSGFDIGQNELNPMLFDYQKEIVQRSLKSGKYALFMDTGLGKSICQLEFGYQCLKRDNKPILFVAPLAVVFQIQKEALKFGYELEFIKNSVDIENKMYITNYDSLKKINTDDFNGIILDESSILKNYTGKIKKEIISNFKQTKYKLACTATPSPNDLLELGNHSEFLDVMESYEMIMRWFINDTMNAGGYRLKKHGQETYWEWISSWADCIGTPSDLGYDGSNHILPKLNENFHYIHYDDVKYLDGDSLFSFSQTNATTISRNKRDTIELRAEKALELINEESHLFWVNTNNEADVLKKMANAKGIDIIEVRGSDSDEVKANRLNDFADGKIKYLITKSSIAGMGLNLQSHQNMTFLGLDYSYERYYQAVRRMWRFGQKKEVNVNIIIADNEKSILQNIYRKKDQHEKMKKSMVKSISNSKVSDELKSVVNKEFIMPSFIKKDSKCTNI